jgi:hypothetical protein
LRVSLLLRPPRDVHGRQPVRHDLSSRSKLKIQAAARLCLQKMLIMQPERRSETRSNVIEEVRNLHWQEIDP